MHTDNDHSVALRWTRSKMSRPSFSREGSCELSKLRLKSTSSWCDQSIQPVDPLSLAHKPCTEPLTPQYEMTCHAPESGLLRSTDQGAEGDDARAHIQAGHLSVNAQRLISALFQRDAQLKILIFSLGLRCFGRGLWKLLVRDGRHARRICCRSLQSQYVSSN